MISLAPAVAVFGSWSLSWCGTKYTPASRHRPIHSMHCDAMRLVRSSFQKATAGTLPGSWLSCRHLLRFRSAEAFAESL